MSMIVHLSDTHFGTEVPAVMEALERSIVTLAPDILIVSGDITQRARRSQFQSAANFLKRLPVRTQLVIPGNHDIPLFNAAARLLTPYANYQRQFGAPGQVWSGQGWGVIGYDTTTPWRHTRGRLSPRALMHGVESVRRTVTEGDLIIACVHQPIVTAWPQDNDEVLLNAHQTAQHFAEQKIDLVLSGHVHVPLHATTRESFPSLPRHFILAGAGTAVSHRIRPGAPNSFNVILQQEKNSRKMVDVTLWEFDISLMMFAPRYTTCYALQVDGWEQS